MDMTALIAALNGVKQVKDVAEAAIGAKQAIEVGRVQSELLPAIVESYCQLLEAKMAQMELTQRLRDAEDAVRQAHDELARRQDWATEAARYALAVVGDQAYAYALKPEAARGEPAHHLCQPCYEQGKKSILQNAGHRDYRRIMACPQCRAEVLFVAPINPDDRAVVTIPRQRIF
ncbi:MAG: hypothetical protein KBD39_11065 [Sterolibacterium sp.]|jgi:hypothetical protein|nr:hypothetical protein [Sterolibacterium sp.]